MSSIDNFDQEHDDDCPVGQAKALAHALLNDVIYPSILENYHANGTNMALVAYGIFRKMVPLIIAAGATVEDVQRMIPIIQKTAEMEMALHESDGPSVTDEPAGRA